MKVPTFLGLGMSRSGTRWLAECLAEHPQVCIAPEEVHFFIRRRLLKNWQKGYEWYERVVRTCDKPGALAWGEISPSYLADDESAELIRRYAPDAKLICSLRDQSEWLYSSYRLFLHFNPQLFATDFSFRTFLLYSPRSFGEVFYLEHIKRYLELFPREQLLILLYDDLKKTPQRYIRDVYKFIGVDDNFVPQSASMTINPMELVVKRSYRLHNVTRSLEGSRKVGRLAKWMDKLNTVHVPRKDLPTRHTMDSALKSEIRDIYAEHNRDLGAFLARDLDHWNSVSR